MRAPRNCEYIRISVLILNFFKIESRVTHIAQDVGSWNETAAKQRIQDKYDTLQQLEGMEPRENCPHSHCGQCVLNEQIKSRDLKMPFLGCRPCRIEKLLWRKKDNVIPRTFSLMSHREHKV